MYTLSRLLGVFVLLGAFSAAHGQEAPVKMVGSTIQKVTVYTNGAQITRQAEVALEEGITQVVFSQISPYISPQSIQLTGTSQLTLLSVLHRENPVADRENSLAFKNLNDSIQKVQFLIDQLVNAKFVTDQEIELILANKKISGEKGTDMAAFEEMQEVFKKKLPALKDEQLRQIMQTAKWQERQEKLKQQLAVLYNETGQSVHEIVATVKTASRIKVTLELSYFTSAASWTPSYDIRCKDLNVPLRLIYKASIAQYTGENWDKVALKISGGNPVLSGTKPDIQPQYLSWQEPMALRGYSDNYNQVPGISRENSMKAIAQPLTNDLATMSNGPLNVEFTIATPYTIASNNKAVLVDVQTFELPAHFSLYTVPKLEKSAFLVAAVSAANEINQLNGMASVYFDGAYAGQSAVQSDENDSMKISMGRDKSIIVERKTVKSKTSRAILGARKTESNEYEISIRNTRSTPITILVEDQLPVSSDKDIEVEKGDLSGANLDENTGKLSWNISLGAGETRKISFGFQVKYPKNRKINAY